MCSNLKDDLCKLNLVLNSFSVSPIYVSWLFEVVSVTVALYTTRLVRKRNITWFNSSFNINVATNVAKTFLSLIDKHFPKDKKLGKIFNRNTIKVSYSCLPNVKQTISNNNHRLLQLHRMKESSQDSKLCNCRQKSSCPLDGKCLTKCVVYKATVS